MALKHESTSVKFSDTLTSKEWEVFYVVRNGLTIVDVFLDNKPFHTFEKIPESVKTKAKHPNKTQAEAIIRLAKKENKK